jgi:hypothetical protein
MEENETKNCSLCPQFGHETEVSLPKAFYRILNAIKVGWWTYKNPEVFGVNVFKMLGDLLNLILKVSTEDRHYMTEIIVTNQRTGVKQPIVHIWAGAGILAEPTKRIQELLEENAMLKERLRSN